MKDRLIQKRHRLTLELNYWKGKYDRFTMTEVPKGFSRRQGVDISVISRYARLYLKSLFHHVYIVKGIATSDFRKIWGLQEEYEKKLRINHCHHAIDAITIACIGKAEYDKLAQYYHDEEQYDWGLDSKRAVFPKPWKTFTEDLKHIEDALLISHYTADNMGKCTRKKVRKNGKLTNEYMQGDTARVQLHLEKYYGAIERDGEIRYVVRKQVEEVDPKNIVDDVVRKKVEDAVKEHGNLKKAVDAGIWMNKEKGIKINKVRIYAPQIKRPLEIRKQRDISPKDYKRNFHVANDSNYMMGIYVGKDARGKEKREFVLVNCLDAVKFYNGKGDNENLLPILSPINKYPLKWELQNGTMVILYEDNPDEIFKLSRKELNRRIYKIKGMSSMVISGYDYGTLSLMHHQEARPSTEVRFKNGVFKNNEITRSGITLLHTQFKGLVQGYDFEMNDIGEIKFLKND
ncbi:MAG: hypothetical protein LUC88_09755 [Prevotella sp.]|nr:hypothetical protein [Prevotella sp.]